MVAKVWIYFVKIDIHLFHFAMYALLFSFSITPLSPPVAFRLSKDEPKQCEDEWGGGASEGKEIDLCCTARGGF